MLENDYVCILRASPVEGFRLRTVSVFFLRSFGRARPARALLCEKLEGVETYLSKVIDRNKNRGLKRAAGVAGTPSRIDDMRRTT